MLNILDKTIRQGNSKKRVSLGSHWSMSRTLSWILYIMQSCITQANSILRILISILTIKKRNLEPRSPIQWSLLRERKGWHSHPTICGHNPFPRPQFWPLYKIVCKTQNMVLVLKINYGLESILLDVHASLAPRFQAYSHPKNRMVPPNPSLWLRLMSLTKMDFAIMNISWYVSMLVLPSSVPVGNWSLNWTEIAL